MKKKKMSVQGLVFTAEIRGAAMPASDILLSALLLFLGMLGMLGTFMSTFAAFPPGFEFLILLLVPLCLLSALCWQNRRFTFAYLLLSGVSITALILLCYGSLFSGAVQVYSSVADTLNGKGLAQLPIPYELLTEESPLLFWVLVSLVSSLLLGAAFIRVRSGILSLAVTAPFLFFGLALGAVPENLIYYMLLLSFYAAAFSSSRRVLHGRRAVRMSAGAAALLVLFSMLSFFVPRVLFPLEDYQRPQWLIDLRADTVSFVSDVLSSDVWNGPFNFPATAGGGIAGGSLGRIGKLEYTGKTALLVTRGREASYYLRAYVGSQYEGVRWSPLTAGQRERIQKESLTMYQRTGVDFASPGLFVTEQLAKTSSPAVSIVNDELRIEVANAPSQYRYTPYGSNTYLSGFNRLDFLQDSFAAADMANGFSESYRDTVSLVKDELTDQFVQYSSYLDYQRSADYRAAFDAVVKNLPVNAYTSLYDKYTEVYGVVEQQYAPQTRQQYQYPGWQQQYSVAEFVTKVKDDVQAAAVYSLEPGVLPAGQDFVDYFLLQSHKGYCVHFATAVATILKQNGVPARYVEGYVLPVDKTYYRGAGTFAVTDRQAHAWIEVYFENFGWIPFEVTPGGGNYTGIGLTGESDISSSASQDQSSSFDASESVSSSPADSIPEEQLGGADGPSNITVDRHGGLRTAEKVLIGCAAVLILLLLLLLAPLLTDRRRIRRLQRAQTAPAACKTYSLRVLSYMGQPYIPGTAPLTYAKQVDANFPELGEHAPGFEQVMRTILQAEYSNLPLREEQYQLLEDFPRRLRIMCKKRLSNAGWLFFRFFKHL